ncbi:MAG: enoyl-CoA hydratase/isomerase family protein [Alphaproteobacteria bacterium]|nr:enoyl-CoA hydratase/isomerase family protein [Alphaproteobacteria bacterium]
MNYETLRTAQDGPAFVITFHRPKVRNALSGQLLEELVAAVKAADADASVRAVILTGGPELFSAGADLNEALEVKSARDGMAFFGRFHRVADVLETADKPVIASIEGFCFTGGCELALACDIRVAGDGASFAITSARIGTVAGFGGTQRLPRIVGASRALEILFSAEPIDAQEAHRIGLVNRLTPKGGALAEAKRLAAIYAERAPLSLAFAKRAVHRGMQTDLASGIELETFLVTTIYGTDDKREGISAFLEKRKAKFTGK